MTALTALRISPTRLDTITLTGADRVEEIQGAIGCHWFDIVGGQDSIDIYVDDEGAINGSPLNLPLTILAHALGARTALFGTGVLLGVNHDTGESLSLSDVQVGRVREILAGPPTGVLLNQVASTLGGVPGVIRMLRS